MQEKKVMQLEAQVELCLQQSYENLRSFRGLDNRVMTLSGLSHDLSSVPLLSWGR